VIVHPVRAGEMARIGRGGAAERYGVDPKQVPDFIACAATFRQVPGAKGVGPAGAATLLRSYGTLERRSPPERFPPRPSAAALPKHYDD